MVQQRAGIKKQAYNFQVKNQLEMSRRTKKHNSTSKEKYNMINESNYFNFIYFKKQKFLNLAKIKR